MSEMEVYLKKKMCLLLIIYSINYFQIVKLQTQMLEKHEQHFNKVTQDIDTWINHKHKNSEVIRKTFC